jgi:hypothetical protein
MPACCFARAIDAKPGVFAAMSGDAPDDGHLLKKKPASAAGEVFREEALCQKSAKVCLTDSAASAKIV